jgi:hypothetical protein
MEPFQYTRRADNGFSNANRKISLAPGHLNYLTSVIYVKKAAETTWCDEKTPIQSREHHSAGVALATSSVTLIISIGIFLLRVIEKVRCRESDFFVSRKYCWAGVPSSVVGRAKFLLASSSPETINSSQDPALEERQGRGTQDPASKDRHGCGYWSKLPLWGVN